MQTSTTDTSYTLTTADVGSTFQVKVTATAGPVDGLTSAAATITSGQTATIAPMSTAVPTITGTAQDVQTLTASTSARVVGRRLDLTRTYQWYRCDAAGANCVSIPSATGSTYVLARADLGHTIAVIVSAAKRPLGLRAERALRRRPPPIGPWPSTTSPGVPAGATQDGATLNAPDITWANSDLVTPTWQWYQCTPASSCSAIPGATSDTYVLQATDVGMQLKAAIIGSVGTGVTTVTTGLTAVVQPLNNGAPSITPERHGRGRPVVQRRPR